MKSLIIGFILTLSTGFAKDSSFVPNKQESCFSYIANLASAPYREFYRIRPDDWFSMNIDGKVIEGRYKWHDSEYLRYVDFKGRGQAVKMHFVERSRFQVYREN